MTIPTLRTLDPTASTFRADVNALFTGGEFNLTIDGINEAIASLSAQSAGTGLSMTYTYSSTTADADPGAGLLRLDNFAAQNAATVIRADLLDAGGNTQTGTLDTFDDSTSTVKGILVLTKTGDATKFLVFSVSAVAAPAGYRNISVTNLSYSSAAPFANADSLLLEYFPMADKGEVGTAGADGTMTATVEDRAADTPLALADANKVIRFTNGFTQTADAVAGIGVNKIFYFRNDSGETVTFDPAGAELVDGVATINIYPGESGFLVTTAIGWVSVGLPPAGTRIELSRIVASSSATVDFTSVLTSAFDEYEVHGIAVMPATDNKRVWLRTSTDNGSTFAAAAADYGYSLLSGSSTSGSNSETEIVLTGTVGNVANESANFVLRIFKPSAAAYCVMNWAGTFINGSTSLSNISGSGMRKAAADVDAIRFLFDAGNIASGTFVLYGIRK